MLDVDEWKEQFKNVNHTHTQQHLPQVKNNVAGGRQRTTLTQALGQCCPKT